MREIVEHCTTVIAKGSKSFALASKIFDEDRRNAALFLYSWCRYCDDEIDRAPNQLAREQQLCALKANTLAAIDAKPQSIASMSAFQIVVKQNNIPAHYPLELLEGMAMDVQGQRYDSLAPLLLYCYRVAGTVGLMMVHVMGVNDENALKHAVDLGIAMQLTNIARDVLEDGALGRVYLPNITLEKVNDPAARAEVFAAVEKLLTLADSYYQSGDEGLRYLSFRAALAVASARAIYSEIGALILKRGSHAWDERVYVTGWKKIFLVGKGFLKVLKTVPQRFTQPWRPAKLTKVWLWQNPSDIF